MRKRTSLVYPGSLAKVLDNALSLGSPNFSRPRKVNWQGLFMLLSMIFPNVVLISYAPGPGPAVGALRGGLDPVQNPISASFEIIMMINDHGDNHVGS